MTNRSGDKKLRQKGHVNECYVCKRKCFTICSRCGEFYCSRNCQIVDWREHKYCCFDMPKLVAKSPSWNDHHHFNNSPKFQSNNRRIVENLRSGEHRLEQPNSSETIDSYRHSLKKSCLPEPVFNFGHYPKNNDDVMLVQVRHANSFYIRACSSAEDYRRNALDFKDFGTKEKPLLSFPRENDVVLVLHNEKFRRAVVLHDVEKDEGIKVELVDTGRKITTFLRYMRQLSDELKNRKRYNFIVTLDQIPYNIKPHQYNKLHHLALKQTAFVIQFDGKDWHSASNFKLFEKESGMPIERLILSENETKFDSKSKVVQQYNGLPAKTSTSGGKPISYTTESSTAPKTRNVEKQIQSTCVVKELEGPHKPITFKDLVIESLPETAKLLILENCTVTLGFVSAVETKNILKLNKLHKKINDIADNIPDVYAPSRYELCLVKFDGQWNRAIYCSPKFLLIDWGNMEDIGKGDVRRFPEELADPCYTFACNIQGAGPEFTVDPVKMEQLKKLLEIGSEHSDCICANVEGKLMEYDVEFPKLSDFFL